ncbi:MAG: TrkH family potassium uptake protein [Firmicutes bacterium]|nr:TrkH family potassium uptake protein [Bacillota bacterium]
MINVDSRTKKLKPLSITPAQAIVIGYLLFDILATILLSLPFSLNPGMNLSIIDALFTATSAISVTGLTVVSTPETFSFIGKVILTFLLQFGGIGIMTLGTLFYVLRGTKVNLLTRMMMKSDQNQTSFSGMIKLMLFILKVAIVLEVIGTVILTIYFWLFYNMPFDKALGFGSFHSVSGFTNAGFDLFGNSLQNFTQDYFIQSVISLLLLAGAIGFPVLMELYFYFKALYDKSRFHFSLYTKVTTVTFFILLIIGFVMVIISESSSALAGLPWHEKISIALFHSLNTRSGGFSTIDAGVLHNAALLFFSLLMFIGASPSSCGGGIRTTTFAIAFLSMLASFRGRSDVRIFRRELYHENITRAFTVFFIATMLVVGSVFLLTILEPYTTNEIVFEVCSAFGTTGLSTGITGDLSTLGKLIIITLMFIGRIGIISLLLFFQGKTIAGPKYHLLKERIIIG